MTYWSYGPESHRCRSDGPGSPGASMASFGSTSSAVGHTDLSREGRWIAAVFACGPKAVLSHASAAHHWSLSPACPPFTHVTIPESGSRTKRTGIVLHRSTTLTTRDVTLRHNTPVTTPARTKRDMGWTKERTRSDLERAFLRLLRAHELPLPELNAKLGPYEIDFLWRERKLCVELDSYAYHSSRASFASDRARDRELQRRGFVVLRFADTELDEIASFGASALPSRCRSSGGPSRSCGAGPRAGSPSGARSRRRACAGRAPRCRPRGRGRRGPGSSPAR